MYRLATKRIAKSEVGNIVNVFMDPGWHAYRKGTARLSTVTHSAHLDLWGSAVNHAAEVCGGVRLRTQICSNCWISRLTANGFFEDVADVDW